MNDCAMDRCSLHGRDEAHEENCWQVVKIHERDEQGRQKVVADHISFREATALLLGISVEELDRQIAELEDE